MDSAAAMNERVAGSSRGHSSLFPRHPLDLAPVLRRPLSPEPIVPLIYICLQLSPTILYLFAEPAMGIEFNPTLFAESRS
jgi:hypothetical protein